MPAPILIAYASKYGSKQEVAESIGATLCERGFDVDVMPMNHVRDLDAREAVVLGMPIYMGRLHGDASAFLAEHMDALASLPVAVFVLGPLNDNDDEVRGAREQLEAALARYPLLSPVAVALFGGKYDPAKLGFVHKMIAAMPAREPVRQPHPEGLWRAGDGLTRAIGTPRAGVLEMGLCRAMLRLVGGMVNMADPGDARRPRPPLGSDLDLGGVAPRMHAGLVGSAGTEDPGARTV